MCGVCDPTLASELPITSTDLNPSIKYDVSFWFRHDLSGLRQVKNAALTRSIHIDTRISAKLWWLIGRSVLPWTR